jgi:membrane protein DedA with SNARE-associated domain
VSADAIYLTTIWAIPVIVAITFHEAAHGLKHGAKVVFLGRFVALLRILAAFLAGVNRMPWRTFLIANASGGIIWAAVFGIGGYFFGKLLLEIHHALAPIVFALALSAFFGCGYLVRRYEARLTVLAERALPGPLVTAVDEKRL